MIDELLVAAMMGPVDLAGAFHSRLLRFVCHPLKTYSYWQIHSLPWDSKLFMLAISGRMLLESYLEKACAKLLDGNCVATILNEERIHTTTMHLTQFGILDVKARFRTNTIMESTPGRGIAILDGVGVDLDCCIIGYN